MPGNPTLRLYQIINLHNETQGKEKKQKPSLEHKNKKQKMKRKKPETESNLARERAKEIRVLKASIAGTTEVAGGASEVSSLWPLFQKHHFRTIRSVRLLITKTPPINILGVCCKSMVRIN